MQQSHHNSKLSEKQLKTTVVPAMIAKIKTKGEGTV